MPLRVLVPLLHRCLTPTHKADHISTQSIFAFGSIMAVKLTNINLGALEDEFKKWVSRKGDEDVGTLSILVTGKSGVGKSRLVNALVGKKVAIEGPAKTPCTANMNSYRTQINGIEVVVWDSPGLQDGTCDEEKYLEAMEKQLHEGLDVMIYCMKMDDKRFLPTDENAIHALTRKFGKDLWKNTVIALTFANNVKDPDGGDKKKFFRRDLDYWKEVIVKFFGGIPEFCPNETSDIPLVPVGLVRKMKLPTCDHWLSELWISCFKRAKVSSRINLYRISVGRVQYQGSENLRIGCGLESDASDVDPDRRIPLTKEQQEAFWKGTWESFVDYCMRMKKYYLVAGLGFAILVSLFIKK